MMMTMLNFKDLNDVDLKLILLSGSSIRIDNLEIEPYKLREIKEYGYTNYMQNLQWISLSIDDFIDFTKDKDKKEILEKKKENLKAFDFYVKLGGREFLEILTLSLSMIFKTDDIRFLNDEVVVINFEKTGAITEDEHGNPIIDKEKIKSITEDEIKVVHRDNFDKIIEVIKLQNYLTKPSINKENEGNPVDDETRALMEHMKKMKEKVEAKKKKQRQIEDEDGDIDISDIISAVSSKSNSINKLNIWELTLYQVYDEYTRLELIDGYDFGVRAMMAGASDVKLSHWSSKI